MTRKATVVCLAAAVGVLVSATLALAQPGSPLPGMMPTGVFLPSEMGACCEGFRVGSWVEYVLVRRGTAARWRLRMATVGREGEAWWIEMTMSDAHRGEAVCKMLVDTGDASRDDRLRRVIIQPEGHLPLELPVKASSGQVPAIEAGSGSGKLVGTERLKVPAGTFEARHYVRGQGDEARHIWVSDKVALWGIAKSRSAKVTLTLAAQGTGAVSRVTEEPVLFDPSAF